MHLACFEIINRVINSQLSVIRHLISYPSPALSISVLSITITSFIYLTHLYHRHLCRTLVNLLHTTLKEILFNSPFFHVLSHVPILQVYSLQVVLQWY